MSVVERTWLGRADNPLCCWVYTCSGSANLDSARGAVVMCQSVGSERHVSYRGMRQLAERLADLGFVVVRFDWSGEGNSAPADASLDKVENSRRDLAQVISTVREWGLATVNIVGLGMGALLAGHLATDMTGITSLIMLDPPASGQRFLRRQRAILGTLELPTASDENTYGPGARFRPIDVAALKRLKLSHVNLPEVATATVSRACGREGESPYPGGSGNWTSSEFEAFLDRDGMMAIVAHRLLNYVTTWVCEHNPSGSGYEVTIDLHPTTEFEIDGVRVRESMLSLPTGMPAMLTEPASAPAAKATLFVAPATQPMDGPVGLWTEAARAAAAHGSNALRFDRHGVGELGGKAPFDAEAFSVSYLDDIAVAAEWLRARYQRSPLGVGLCSSAYLLMLPSVAPLFEKVLAFNLAAFDADPSTIPLGQRHPLFAENAGEIVPGLQTPTKGYRRWLKHHLPHSMWVALGRAGVARAPDRFLQTAARATKVDMIFGPFDGRNAVAQRVPEAIARVPPDRIRFISEAYLDHTSLTPTGREVMLRILLAELDHPADRLGQQQAQAG